MTTQRHLNLAQTDLDRKDQEYSSKLAKALDDLARAREQRQLAEKVLGENVEKNRTLEAERTRLAEKVSRLETELAKLEEESGREKNSKERVLGEVERFRSERVDDALLIEQLRENQAAARVKINEMVGVFSSLQNYLDQLVSADE